MNRQRRHPARTRLGAAVFVSAAALAVSACASSGSAAPGASAGPITIGMSLPMTGQVADLSKSGYQGYELWASQVTAAGGLLGRKVKLIMLDNGFDPNQTAADYTRLISSDHVALLLGTFSSLLNAPASAI